MTRQRRSLDLLAEEQLIYFAHVIALLRPGHEVKQFTAYDNEAALLTGWDPDELQWMIDEGRRQVDGQGSDLKEIRGRAQWLFTVSLPIATAVAATLTSINQHVAAVIFWAIGLVLIAYATLGAAAILTVRADFEKIDTAVLSQAERPIKAKLATDYSEMMGAGENTVAARLTVYRQAVTYLIIGGAIALLVWAFGR